MARLCVVQQKNAHIPNVTERVERGLIRGDYENYDQIAREEKTSRAFVTNRASILRKKGIIVGDGRTMRALKRSQALQQNTVEVQTEHLDILKPGKTSRIVDPNQLEKKLEVYAMMGVSDHVIQIMKKTGTDLSGYRRMQKEVDDFQRDKRLEWVLSQLDSDEKIDQIYTLLVALEAMEADPSRFLAILQNVESVRDLLMLREKQENRVQDKKAEIQNITAQLEMIRKGLETKNDELSLADHKLIQLESKIAELESQVGNLEQRKARLIEFVEKVRQGHGYEDLVEMVHRGVEKVMNSNNDWTTLSHYVGHKPISDENLTIGINARMKLQRHIEKEVYASLIAGVERAPSDS